MKKISVVTAKVVRENEQYAYKLVGKGGKYIVMHEDGENAGEKVVEKLSPFAKELVEIQQVSLMKSMEVVGDTEAESVYKAHIEYSEMNEVTGGTKKQTLRYFVCADNIKEAYSLLADFIHEFVDESAIQSIIRTNIIEVIGNGSDD